MSKNTHKTIEKGLPYKPTTDINKKTFKFTLKVLNLNYIFLRLIAIIVELIHKQIKKLINHNLVKDLLSITSTLIRIHQHYITNPSKNTPHL